MAQHTGSRHIMVPRRSSGRDGRRVSRDSGPRRDNKRKRAVDPHAPAVVFTALNGSFSAFLTIRAVIISGHPGTGTEVWIHLEAQDSPRSRGIIRSFEPFIRSGLAYMEGELGVSA